MNRLILSPIYSYILLLLTYPLKLVCVFRDLIVAQRLESAHRRIGGHNHVLVSRLHKSLLTRTVESLEDAIPEPLDIKQAYAGLVSLRL